MDWYPVWDGYTPEPICNIDLFLNAEYNEISKNSIL
jgi:hypothetical protein